MNEITELENKKESLLMDIRRLSGDKDAVLIVIKCVQKLHDDVLYNVNDAQKKLADVNSKIDGVENYLREVQGKAKHVIENADLVTLDAIKKRQEIDAAFVQLNAEKAKLKQDQLAFSNKLRTANIQAFDYELRVKELENIKASTLTKGMKLDADRNECIKIQRKLEEAISKYEAARLDLDEKKRALESIKSNFTDSQNRINEAIAYNENLKKKLDKKIAALDRKEKGKA